MVVAAMEARATVVVATNHRVAATVDLAVAADMEAVVVTAVEMTAEVAATAEATMLAAAQVEVQAPTGEVATRTPVSARAAATAVAMVAAAVAVATTTSSPPHTGAVPSHHLASLDLNPVVVQSRLHHHLVATRSSLATLTSQLMKIL